MCVPLSELSSLREETVSLSSSFCKSLCERLIVEKIQWENRNTKIFIYDLYRQTFLVSETKFASIWLLLNAVFCCTGALFKYKFFPSRLCVWRNMCIICCVLWSDTQVPHAHVCMGIRAESLNRCCWCWVRTAVSVWPPSPLIHHTLMFLPLPPSLKHFNTTRLSSTLFWS